MKLLLIQFAEIKFITLIYELYPSNAHLQSTGRYYLSIFIHINNYCLYLSELF